MHFLHRWLPFKSLVCSAGLLASAVAASALTLARPFGSHMVLPMERTVPVWGTASAGARVRVEFAGREFTTNADRQGNWRLALEPMPASSEGKPLIVRVGNEQCAISDVLVGRVFLCSGQSNMDYPLGRATGGRAEAANGGKWPAIRLLNLTGAPTDGRVYDQTILSRLNPRDHFSGEWQTASPESAAAFSAIAWWVGQAIHQSRGVPVGLVENAVGGSGTEAWLPREVLASRPEYADLLGEQWLRSEKTGAWARGRALLNLGSHLDSNHPFKPGFLFESGVRPFAGFPFDGVVWYQGETNAEINDPQWNERLITDLVAGWRKVLGCAELPWYLIQLPRIGGSDPLRQFWPEYRQVQAEASRKLPHVRLIVTKDLGWDSPDVHPPDKRPVAARVAEAVLADLPHRKTGL